jgi:hypothetical protein
VFKPDEPLGCDVESLAYLGADFFHAIGDATARIARHLKASDYDPPIGEVNSLNEANAVSPISGRIGEEFKLI